MNLKDKAHDFAFIIITTTVIFAYLIALNIFAYMLQANSKHFLFLIISGGYLWVSRNYFYIEVNNRRYYLIPTILFLFVSLFFLLISFVVDFIYFQELESYYYRAQLFIRIVGIISPPFVSLCMFHVIVFVLNSIFSIEMKVPGKSTIKDLIS